MVAKQFIIFLSAKLISPSMIRFVRKRLARANKMPHCQFNQRAESFNGDTPD
jgi:hypothetical protein